MAKTRALAKYDAELAKYAQQAADTEAGVGGGNFISLRGGHMQYKGAEIPGNKMNVIIIDHILANLFYEGNFDPDNPTSPVCYAFGRDEDELVPHEQAAQPQADNCDSCQQNEWPDARAKQQGQRGKPCKNSRRLAMVTEGDMEELENAEIAYLQIPVTSVKAWAGYVRQIKDTLNRPPFAVVTEVSVVPDPKSQFKVEFELINEIDDADALAALIDLRRRVEKEIDFPFPLVQIEEAPPVRRGRAVSVAPARQPRRAAPAPPPPPQPRRVAVAVNRPAKRVKY